MYRLIDWKETAGAVAFKIEYSFSDGTTIKEPFSFPTKEEGIRYYAWHIHVFLRFRMEDFRKAVAIVKPYYLDRDHPSFAFYDGGWREDYYRFQFGLNTRLEKLAHLDVTEYAKMVVQYLPVIKALVPPPHVIGHREMTSMYDDIKYSSGKVLSVVKVLHDDYSPLNPAI